MTPKQLEEIDLPTLRLYAECYVKDLAEGKMNEDFPQYMFEAVMITLYGPNIFDWINEHNDQ